jgi:hypothetical protein
MRNEIDVVNNEGETLNNTDLANHSVSRKSIIRIVFASVLILALIAAGAVLFVSIKTYYVTSKQTENYFARAESIQADIKDNLVDLNDKFAVERLNKYFTKDEVYSIVYNLWKYELLINDVPVDKSASAVTIKKGDIISIKETLSETLLPEEFAGIGNLTRGDANDSLKNHFALNKKTYNLTGQKEGLTTVYTVNDLQLSSAESFNMLLSVQLQERLGFVTDVIVVTVK